MLSFENSNTANLWNNVGSKDGNLLSKFSFSLPKEITTITATTSSQQKQLGFNFQPGPLDVVCGRGKGSYNRPGNVHFRKLVTTYIPAYQQAKTKIDKSTILNSIIDKVRSLKNPNNGRSAQFLKHSKDKGWIEIGDLLLIREKVGHTIREAIAAKENEPIKAMKKEKIMAKQSMLLSKQQSIFAAATNNYNNNNTVQKQQQQQPSTTQDDYYKTTDKQAHPQDFFDENYFMSIGQDLNKSFRPKKTTVASQNYSLINSVSI